MPLRLCQTPPCRRLIAARAAHLRKQIGRLARFGLAGVRLRGGAVWRCPGHGDADAFDVVCAAPEPKERQDRTPPRRATLGSATALAPCGPPGACLGAGGGGFPADSFMTGRPS